MYKYQRIIIISILSIIFLYLLSVSTLAGGTTSNLLIEPGSRVGNLYLYSSINDIITIIGSSPNEIKECRNGYEFYFATYGLVISTDKSRIVRSILTSNGYYTDSYGIRVGMTIDYPRGYYQDGSYSDAGLCCNDRGIAFIMDDRGIIKGIAVFQPGFNVRQ